MFKSKIKYLPSRAGERYASALTNMSLSNRVYKYFGKIDIKDYIGDFCERVIPDPIPNSEVKPFCADGTLS